MKQKNNTDIYANDIHTATKFSEKSDKSEWRNMEMTIDIYHRNKFLGTTLMPIADYRPCHLNNNNTCEKRITDVLKDFIINTVKFNDDTDILLKSLKKGRYKKYVIIQKKQVNVTNKKAISNYINLCMIKNNPIHVIIVLLVKKLAMVKHEYIGNNKSDRKNNRVPTTLDVVHSSSNPLKITTIVPDTVQSLMDYSVEKSKTGQSLLKSSEENVKPTVKFPPLTLKSLKKLSQNDESKSSSSDNTYDDVSSSDDETISSEESNNDDDEEELCDVHESSLSSSDNNSSSCSEELKSQTIEPAHASSSVHLKSLQNHNNPAPSLIKSDTILQKSLMRIKAGDRFRVEFEIHDIFEGTKRKQWFFGTAKKVTKFREDVFTTSNKWNYQLEIAYDDSSCGRETYPSPGVELLLPCNESTKVHALTHNGDIALAYDKDIKSIHAGDLVDCRVKRSHPLERARVVSANKNEGTCSVIFINQEEDCFEPNIPTKAGHIICVQQGAQDVGWLLGASFAENEKMGKIIRVHCSYPNGHASSFEVQIQDAIVIRSYTEVIHNLFSSFVSDCTQEVLGNTFIV